MTINHSDRTPCGIIKDTVKHSRIPNTEFTKNKKNYLGQLLIALALDPNIIALDYE